MMLIQAAPQRAFIGLCHEGGAFHGQRPRRRRIGVSPQQLKRRA
jgi:hypothetical protein